MTISRKRIQATTAAMLAATVSQVAHAAYTTNDLYLGFTSSSAQGDYIIDLGQATTAVGVGGSKVVNLSSLISSSTFNSIFPGGANGVSVAVVGSDDVFQHYDVYATEVRVGGAGTAGVAGSDLTSQGHSSTQIQNGSTVLTGNPWPTAGNGTNDTGKSYTAKVESTTGSFFNKTGVQPAGTFDASGIIYEDLWFATPTAAYAYQGYFTFDFSSATPKLTFTPAGAASSYTPPPPPKLGIVRSGGTSTISFGTTNGATYTLIYTNTTGLSSARSTWPTLGSPLTGNGGNMSFTDSSTDPNRVYSVKAH